MNSSKTRTFPFLPKSNALLQPGDFWGIRLSANRFAAGRVIALPWQVGSKDRRTFLAALMDWHGSAHPVSDDLTNRQTLDQGAMHVRAFSFSGWTIDGNRDLSLEAIEPWLFKTAENTQFVQKGLQEERLGTVAELLSCPVRGTWGMTYIVELAKRHFIRSMH